MLQLLYISILMTRHYLDQFELGENLLQPIRSTTHSWLVTRHQDGDSALVSDVAKFRLFSQAIQTPQITKQRPTMKEQNRQNANYTQKMKRHTLFQASGHLAGSIFGNILPMSNAPNHNSPICVPPLVPEPAPQTPHAKDCCLRASWVIFI